MAFTDDFNRADEDLEASANWTLVDGAAGAARVTSNALDCTSAQSTGSYHCPDQASPNHYSQAKIKTVALLAGSFIGVRLTDGANFIGARYYLDLGRWEVYKRVIGSFTLLGSYVATLTSGDVVYIEAASSDNIALKVNGALRIGPVSEVFNNTETRQGILPRIALQANWIDDFEAGALVTGVSIPILQQNMRGGFNQMRGGFNNG